jgi:hypothetical protein
MDKLINFPPPRAFRSYPALLRELRPASTAGNEGEASVSETLQKETSSSSIEDPLLCNVELPLRAVFYPLGFAFEIVTNSQAVLDAAGESWRHSRPRDSGPTVQLRIGVTARVSGSCPPAPVARGQQHLISLVADAQNHAICDLNAGFAFAWLTEDALQNRSYARYHFIEAVALILISTTYATPIHAACVSRYGRGMLLCGPSGAGKSTLAYACARRGWIFTSDDASYLRHHANELRVVGNSHQVRFRPSAKDLFPELRGRNITPRAEGKPSIEVPTAELPGILTADETLVHHIILLNRVPSAYAELRSLPREAAQQYFRQYLQLPDKIQEMQAEAAKSIFTADVHELRYQDLEQAIECLDLLAFGQGKPTGQPR